MKSLVRAIVLLVFAIIAIPFAVFLLIQSKLRGKPRPAKAVTEADIANAERRLGFALPDELRTFFRPPRPKSSVDCAELYGLRSAVAEYRMLTREPYGPNGQDWPRELFPVADLLPGYACYDLNSGQIVEWDPEDLGEEDDDPKLWDRSFKKTGKTLGGWLTQSL